MFNDERSKLLDRSLVSTKSRKNRKPRKSTRLSAIIESPIRIPSYVCNLFCLTAVASRV